MRLPSRSKPHNHRRPAVPLSPVIGGEGWGEGPSSIRNPQSELRNEKRPSPRPSPLSTGERGKRHVALSLAAAVVFAVASGCAPSRPASAKAAGPTAGSLYADGMSAYRAGDKDRAVQ